MSHIIEHYGPQGRILKFRNAPGVYPVNRYQSLILATHACAESFALAAVGRRSLSELRAIEVCCGGGPAAVALRAAGIGYVEAADLNPLAVELCKENAALNDLQLDRVNVQDLLGATRPPSECFDIIACNPPCGRSKLYEHVLDSELQSAVDGGPQGIDFVQRLIASAQDHLSSGGRLVFSLTSTMSFMYIIDQLNHLYSGQWRPADATPIAQPYLQAKDPRAAELFDLCNQLEVFVWAGDDGWIWRLSWIIVVENHQKDIVSTLGRLWFRPHGYDPAAASYRKTLKSFRQRI